MAYVDQQLEALKDKMETVYAEYLTKVPAAMMAQHGDRMRMLAQVMRKMDSGAWCTIATSMRIGGEQGALKTLIMRGTEYMAAKAR